MTITTIGDAVRALIQSFQVATIFPAGLLVFVNAYILLPRVLGYSVSDLTSFTGFTAVVSITLMLSYALYAFNYPLIRFFEGYKWTTWDVFRRFRSQKRDKYISLLKEIDSLVEQQNKMIEQFGFDPENQGTDQLSLAERGIWEALRARYIFKERELDERFPRNVNAVLPTDLGNIIAAFEAYPGSRYGMDAIALWPRLVPILRDAKYTDFVNQEKSVFDFLLNSMVVIPLLGAELFYIGLYLQENLFVALGLSSPVIALGLYNGLLIAGRQWGTTVRVAFDLYRHDLRRKLGVIPAKTFKEEFKRWERISCFYEYRPESPDIDDLIAPVNWDKLTSKAD